MSIKQFDQELSKGLPSPAYLLYSSEDFLLYEALSAIRERVAGDNDAFNFDAFDMKSSDDTKPAEQIIDILNTLPFLSEKRAVVIQNIQKIPKKDIKKIEDYISNPSASSLLVMLFEGSAPKLFDPALKNIKTIAVTVPEKDIPLWIKERAKKKGIDITERAIEYLINSAGTDLGMLYSEIEKFSTWNTAGAIDLDDIKGIVYSGAEYSAFDLVNALRAKNAKEVFRIFENVGKNTEPQMLLGALNWQYANLQSRDQSNDKKARQRFRRIFCLLHKADADIKTSHSHVMEDLLVKLLALS
jgi:DNA polymerase-3 subunit delta